MKLSKLKSNPRNPRLIRDERFEKLKQSIRDFPKMMALRPMVVDSENVVLGGNQRLKALTELGYKEIPDDWVKKASELTEDEIRRFVVLDNESFGNPNWEILSEDYTTEELQDWGIEVEDYRIEPEAHEDNFEIPDEIKTDIVVGDLFEIGSHRLLCGDSTDSQQVAKLMGGEKAILCNTDPPYGIDFVQLSKSKGQSQNYGDIENDNFKDAEFQDFLEKCIKASLPFLQKNTAFYFWHPMLTQGYFAAAAAADIIINRQIIWVKPSLVFGRGDYHWKHELCFYGWIKGNKPEFYGERNQTTIWEAGRENDKIHPTQKPIKLFEIPILNHTKENDIVYEPFSGSGSQMVAAHQLNRRCFGMEISPQYCQIIIDRMKQLDPNLVIKKNGTAMPK